MAIKGSRGPNSNCAASAATFLHTYAVHCKKRHERIQASFVLLQIGKNLYLCKNNELVFLGERDTTTALLCVWGLTSNPRKRKAPRPPHAHVDISFGESSTKKVWQKCF